MADRGFSNSCFRISMEAGIFAVGHAALHLWILYGLQGRCIWVKGALLWKLTIFVQPFIAKQNS